MSLFSDKIEACQTFATKYKEKYEKSNIFYFNFYLENPGSSNIFYKITEKVQSKGALILEHFFIKDNENIYMSNTGNGFSYSSNDYKRHFKEKNLTIQIFFDNLINIFNAINSLNLLNSNQNEVEFRAILENISSYLSLIFNMKLNIDYIVQLYTTSFHKDLQINKANKWSYIFSIDDRNIGQDIEVIKVSLRQLQSFKLVGGKKKSLSGPLYYKLNKKTKKKRRRRRRVTKKVPRL